MFISISFCYTKDTTIFQYCNKYFHFFYYLFYITFSRYIKPPNNGRIMLKKFLLLILLMPLLAKGQSTTTPLPTSTAYTPQFRYTSTAADTLKQIWVYSGSKYNRWYTATEINARYGKSFKAQLDSFKAANNTWTAQQAFLGGFYTGALAEFYDNLKVNNGKYIRLVGNTAGMDYFIKNGLQETNATLDISRGVGGVDGVSIIGSNIKDFQGKYFLKTGDVPDSAKVFKKDSLIYVNAKSFGATGNGTTNDRVALQAAVDYQHSIAGKSYVYFPKGTYKAAFRNQPIPKASWGTFAARDSVDYAIVVYDNTRFIGENRDSTILKLDSASLVNAIAHNTTRSSYFIESYLDFASNMSFENMTIDGSKLNNTVYPEMDLVSVDGNNVVIRNVNTINSTGDNIDTDAGDNLIVDNVYTARANKSGINMAPDLIRFKRGTITNTVVEGNVEGIVSRGEKTFINNVTFTNNKDTHLNINNNGATQTGVTSRLIQSTNNKFSSDSTQVNGAVYWSRCTYPTLAVFANNEFVQNGAVKNAIFNIPNLSNAGRRDLKLINNKAFRGTDFVNSGISNATALRIIAVGNTLDSLTNTYTVLNAAHVSADKDLVNGTLATNIMHTDVAESVTAIHTATVEQRGPAATTSTGYVNKSQLDLKANLASPALTGTPTSTTATAGTNTTQIATTAFVQSATAALIDNVLSKTANYTIVSGDFAAGKKTTLDLYVDATAGNVTITRPSATTFAGYTIYVTKTDASANTVTIGSDILTTQNQVRQYNSNGTSWYNH